MTEHTVSDEQATSVEELEAEGEVAADYIEELLDICDLDGDIDIDVRDGRAYLAVTSDDEESNLNTLGTHQAVAALQELTRLAVQAKTGAFSRLILDVQRSREQRQQELAQLVDDSIARLEADGGRIALKPMSSYERKLVHDLVAERGLVSESEGAAAHRHVVISAAS